MGVAPALVVEEAPSFIVTTPEITAPAEMTPPSGPPVVGVVSAVPVAEDMSLLGASEVRGSNRGEGGKKR